MKNSKNGFTLMELLVVIVIIGILAVSASNLSFNTQTNKQKLDIYQNKIVSTYETVRNDSIIGKGVGTSTDVPDFWKMEFSTSSPEMKTSYDIGGTITEYSDYSNTAQPGYSISDLECLSIDGTVTDSIPAIPTLTFGSGNILLSGCSGNLSKKLKITTKYIGIEKSFTINVVNGLVDE